MNHPKIIYLYGIDGSGKSTLAWALVAHLEQQGRRVEYQWLRFNHYCAKLVNAVGKLRGLAFVVDYPDGTRIGYHHYHKAPLLGLAYCLATIIDSWLALVFKLRLWWRRPDEIIVVDRFVYDSIVDLSIDTADQDFPVRRSAKWLARLLPATALAVYIDTDKRLIGRRRPDIHYDAHFDTKHQLYRTVYRLYGQGRKIANNGTIAAALQAIVALID